MTTTTRNTDATATATAGMPSPVDGHATVTDTPTPRVVIDHVTITNPSVVAAARRWADHHHTGNVAAWVVRTVELGARAAALAAGNTDLDGVRTEVQTLTRTVNATADMLADRIARTVADATTPGTGTIPAAVAAELDRLTGELGQVVGSEDGPVRTAVDRTLAAAQERLVTQMTAHLTAHADQVRRLIDPDSDGGPLATLRRSHTEALDRLTAQVTAVAERLAATDATAAERQRGPRKGEPFETAVHRAVGRIAAAAGDHVDPVGTAAGRLGSSKKGDVTVTVQPAGPVVGRVTFEAKDQKRSTASWLTYLEEARANRGAHVAVAVVASADQVPSGGPVEVLDDGTIVVAHTPAADDPALLTAVYRLARARALEAASRTAAGTADAAALAAAVAGARRRLDDIADLTRLAANSRRATEKVCAAVDTLGAALTDDLDRISASATPEAA